MATDTVQIRHKTSLDVSSETPKFEESLRDGAGKKRMRPKSASYAALRSAVFKLTCLSDFTKEKIGSGFFADVFKVRHKVSGEVLVLKMNKSRKTSKQMLSEIQLMNRLSHPNILRFKGSCVHEGQLHALTEFINGGSLEDLLQDHSAKLSWSVRVKIARDIARGMAYLHSRGVFHRDLNSRNCLIQRNPDGSLTAVVADFGLAAKIKQKRYTETVGSPYWMAPECLRGKTYCELADVFSFGITLAEIMTRMPADPDFMPRTSHYGVNREAMQKLCIGCPEKLFELMCKCCQLDPDDRPSFEEVVKTLEAISIDGEPITPTLFSTQPADDRSTSDDDYNLRSCFSEPFLKLDDPSVDSDGSSCQLECRLGSLGSSTASSGSSCSSLNEGSKVVDSTEMPQRGSGPRLVQSIATSDLHHHSRMSQPSSNGVDQSNGVYSTVDHASFQKEVKRSNSLTLPISEQTDHGLVPNWNTNIQTSITDTEITTGCSEFTNGGADSGIDPGELEVFKFPPTTEGCPTENTECGSCKGSKELALCEEGEQTPLCSSPSYKLSPPVSRKLTPQAPSPHGLSPVRTPSDGSASCLYATPSSPFAQSWASSELSFCLPNPSTPYAPPCTPVSTHRHSSSCPSSPNSHPKQFRFSLDVSRLNFSSVDSDSPVVSGRHSRGGRNLSKYFDQDSLDSDLEEVVRDKGDSLTPNRRSVHFEEDDIVGTGPDHRFSKTNTRNRSHSNPARPILKQTTSYSVVLADSSNYSAAAPECRKFPVGSKPSNAVLCKGYNITMQSNARLSSSVPNLFMW